MVFGLFEKRRSNKSNKRTNRKLRSKTSKRRRSKRVRGGALAYGEYSAAPAVDGGAEEAFMMEPFENHPPAPVDGGVPTPQGAGQPPQAPPQAPPAQGGDKIEGGRRRKFRKGRKAYVPELTALALTAANFYGPKGKSRKMRRSRKNKSARKGGKSRARR